MPRTTYQVTTHEVYDATTGEISRIEKTKRQTVKIESGQFYMTFIDFMAPIFQLKNSTDKSVLSWLCCNAQFDSGKVILSAKERKICCENLGISRSMLSKSLKNLSDKRLIAGDDGSYFVNAQIFWKGDLKTRNAFIDSKEFEINFIAKPTDGIEEIGNTEEINEHPNEFEI